MKELKVELGSRSYPIKIGSRLLNNLGEELKNLGFKGQILVITDENVSPLYGEACMDSLKASNYKASLLEMPPGEGTKSWHYADKIFTRALELGLDRESGIVALGGGVIGDLAGFAAATFMRGISYVQVPTTLLAQVDSSVGGKVAINHPRGKNMIGAFYQPLLVLIDLDTLHTLPYRELRSGMAEVVKYGIIRDPSFFNTLYQGLTPSLKQDKKFFQDMVYTSCSIKGEIVSADEREGGVRAILNFGHTLGHALEGATGYRYFNHGEAVNYGMLLASRLAWREGILEEGELEPIENLLYRVGFLEFPRDITREGIMEVLKHDKKRREGRLVFILPEKIGRVGIYDDIAQEKVERLIQDFLKEMGKI